MLLWKETIHSSKNLDRMNLLVSETSITGTWMALYLSTQSQIGEHLLEILSFYMFINHRNSFDDVDERFESLKRVRVGLH